MKQVKKFWKWFQTNEEALKNALLLGINTAEVFRKMERNYNSISTRIGYYIMVPNDGTEKSKIIFTAWGYGKLSAKIKALGDLAPELRYFSVQASITPTQQRAAIKKRKDPPYNFDRYSIRISQLYMSLLDYNIESKQLKVCVHFPNEDEMTQCEYLDANLTFVVMNVIGETAFKKHIKYIEYIPLEGTQNGLVDLIDLPDYIDYLYHINSRRKTRAI